MSLARQDTGLLWFVCHCLCFNAIWALHGLQGIIGRGESRLSLLCLQKLHTSSTTLTAAAGLWGHATALRSTAPWWSQCNAAHDLTESAVWAAAGDIRVFTRSVSLCLYNFCVHFWFFLFLVIIIYRIFFICFYIVFWCFNCFFTNMVDADNCWGHVVKTVRVAPVRVETHFAPTIFVMFQLCTSMLYHFNSCYIIEYHAIHARYWHFPHPPEHRLGAGHSWKPSAWSFPCSRESSGKRTLGAPGGLSDMDSSKPTKKSLNASQCIMR